MSDNLRRYHAIRNALVQASPAPPTGNLARHLSPLAALLSGIVGSKSTQLPPIAAQVPNGTKPESRVKRFARCFDNDHSLDEVYFSPMRTSCSGIAPSSHWGSSWMAGWRAAVVWRSCSTWSIKVAPCRWRGGYVKARRGTCPQTSIAPWSSWSAGSYRRVRRWSYSAMAHVMGPACNKRYRPQAGRRCAGRVATGRRGGTARPVVSTPWGRAASLAPSWR
jgi:hypothetical protein